MITQCGHCGRKIEGASRSSDQVYYERPDHDDISLNRFGAAPPETPASRSGESPLPTGKLKSLLQPDTPLRSNYFLNLNTGARPSPVQHKVITIKSFKQAYDSVFEELEESRESKLLKDEGQPGLPSIGGSYISSKEENTGPWSLEKRNKKIGTSCGFKKFNALDYPSPKQMHTSAKFYHFTDSKSCDNFAFEGSTTVGKGLKLTDYQVEHILEWQVVTYFFEWLEHKKLTGAFRNPNPDATRRAVKFCQYWGSTWMGNGSPVFRLDRNDVKSPLRNAIQHLIHAYPGKNNFPEEFVWLHAPINAPAKAEMWSKKETERIYSVTTTTTKGKVRTSMTDLIMGTKGTKKIPQALPTIKSAREAYFKLKWILGARLYLQDPEVSAIFRKQKERIGNVLGALDIEMESQPKSSKNGLVWRAWERQGLQALWDEYMDERFAMAKRRTENDVDKYIRLLEGKWAGQEEVDADEEGRAIFSAQIEKLKQQWAAERNSWTAPWK